MLEVTLGPDLLPPLEDQVGPDLHSDQPRYEAPLALEEEVRIEVATDIVLAGQPPTFYEIDNDAERVRHLLLTEDETLRLVRAETTDGKLEDALHHKVEIRGHPITSEVLRNEKATKRRLLSWISH